ncbi:unnamed protein product, partial [Discosporangium mesarthrocarpum]
DGPPCSPTSPSSQRGEECSWTGPAVGGAVVTAVEGDLGRDGLGLSPKALLMLKDAGVTHALHCAASVSFSEPLPTAATANATGALRVAALVASWATCR